MNVISIRERKLLSKYEAIMVQNENYSIDVQEVSLEKLAIFSFSKTLPDLLSDRLPNKDQNHFLD